MLELYLRLTILGHDIMYNIGATITVRIIRRDSEYFSVMMGLHQGSTLSPFLFSLIIDGVMI